jgi:hypothetical protein
MVKGSPTPEIERTEAPRSRYDHVAERRVTWVHQRFPLVIMTRDSFLAVVCRPFCKGSLKRRHEAHLPETVGGPATPHDRSGTGIRSWSGCRLLLALLACARPAFAQDGCDCPADVEPIGVSAEARADEAWRRVEIGDWVGARLMAAEAMRAEPDLEPEALYITAVSWELDRRHDDAIAVFDDLIDRFPDHVRAVDAQFRRALTLADAGRPDEALRALRGLGTASKLRRTGADDEDLRKVELVRATWIYDSGRRRSGLRRITRALDGVEPSELTWFQGAAHAAVLRHELLSSQALDFNVPDSQVRERLDARGAHVDLARARLDALIRLNEPWYILEALRQFGESFEDLADDLLAAPRPAGMSRTAAAIFDATVSSRAVDQLVKAQQYHALGLDFALQVRWIGPETQALRATSDRLVARIEALDADEPAPADMPPSATAADAPVPASAPASSTASTEPSPGDAPTGDD